MDRLRRLRWEIEELEREATSAAQSSTNGGDGSALQGTDAAGAANKNDSNGIPPAAILEQLSALSASLAKVEQASAGGTGVTSDGALLSAEWQDATRALVRKLQESKLYEPSQSGENAEEAQARTAEGANGPRRDLSLLHLEGKVTELEKFVGVRDILVDEANTLQRPLSTSVSRLEQQLSLLTQPRHLDAISRRVKLLSTELERLHEAKRKAPADSKGISTSGGSRQFPVGNGAATGTAELDAETRAKLSSLFALQTRLEPLIPLAPSLLARMRSLATLHASSSTFASNLEATVKGDAQLKAGQTELKTMLAEAEESLKENVQAVKGNLEAVEKRMEELAERIAKLQ